MGILPDPGPWGMLFLESLKSLFRGMSHTLPPVRELLPRDLNMTPDLGENHSISFVLAPKGITPPFKFSSEISLYFPAVLSTCHLQLVFH